MNTEAPQFLDLFAGSHSNGEPVFERVPALAAAARNCYYLQQSPLFAQGAASGDMIELLSHNPGRFRVRERSGQLAVRVLCRGGVEQLAEELTPLLEKLGGRLDVTSPRALVYCIHVAVGFREIERILDPLVQAAGATWSYGNVYAADSGEPLDWWEDLLNP
jgi:hypothetical protein